MTLKLSYFLHLFKMISIFLLLTHILYFSHLITAHLTVSIAFKNIFFIEAKTAQKPHQSVFMEGKVFLLVL